MIGKKTNVLYKKSKILVIGILLIATSFFSVATIKAEETKTSEYSTLKYSFSFNEPVLQNKKLKDVTFTNLVMDGSYSIGLDVGEPTIQVKPIKILLPQGEEIIDISVDYNNLIEIDTISKGFDLKEKPIIPYQKPYRIGEETPDSYNFDLRTYEKDDLLPNDLYDNVDVGFCRGYSILTLDLYPCKYNPSEGKLFYYDILTVNINLMDTSIVNEFYRGNDNDKEWVQSLVQNPDLANTYSDSGLGDQLYDGGLCDPSDNGGEGYQYVIITRDALFDFSETYTWDDLINRKELEGLHATKVKVEDIISCPDYFNDNNLFNDTPAKIREFCRDAYEDWGTEYILIAGDNDGTNIVERRKMAYEDESDVDSDIYWTHLDNTFNNDHDTLWGERGDGGFDLYSELYSGSLPCDTTQDISNWLSKNFFYADALDIDYLDNAAFYGGDTTWNCQGDDFIEYSAIKGTDNWLGPDPDADGPYPSWAGFQYGFETWNQVNPGLQYDLSVKWTAEPTNPGWQGGSESASIAGLKNAINNDQCTLISGIAHANEGMSLDVYDSSWESDYHNTMPFFLHDYGCHCGDMDATDDGVLHSMLFHDDTELAFACVYNTGYGWGNFDTTNSSSALQQKSFWDYLFDVTNNSGSTFNWQLGKAQEWARDMMASTINWDPTYGTWRGIIESCLLFGDPAQKIKPPMQAEHNVGVTVLDVPTHVTPDEEIYVDATIVNNGENDENNIVVSFRVDGTEVDSITIPSMISQTTEDVSFPWTPTLGWYTVTINATITGVEEEFYFDNEKSRIVIAGPDIAISNLNTPIYAGLDVTTPISGTVENLGTNSETITAYLVVDSVDEDSQTFSLNSGENTIVSFDWIPDSTGTYPVGIRIESSGDEPYLGNNEMYNDITVFEAEGYVLLVDDDRGDTYESYYENALLASSYLYDYWDHDSQGTPSVSTMNSYSAVVWFTGDDYTYTLETADITALTNYLDVGGLLFITGQDIGYDIRTDPFYADYLHATYNVDDTNIYRLIGVDGDPVGGGLTIDISSGDGANNQNYPSGVAPVSPGVECFEYESSTYDAAVRTQTDDYKVVYFAFGFEAISTAGDRNTVMSRVLTWLGGDFSTPEIWVNPSSFDINLPIDGTTDEILTIGNDASATAELNFDIELESGWNTQWYHAYGDDGHAQFAQPVGDIDEDGMNEVIVGGYSGSQAHILQYNTGTGVYDDEHTWSEGGGVPSGCCILDLNDDSDKEFVVSWVYGSSNGIYAYDWDGSTLTTLDVYTGTGFDFAYDVYCCDYDDDTDVEVLIVNDPSDSSGYHVTALSWDNDLDEFVWEESWSSGSSTECPMVWSGDPDNDGKTEVICGAGDSTVYALNYEDGSWTEEIVASGLSSHPYAISVGDIDGDNIDEIGFGLEAPYAYLYEWTGSGYTQIWSDYYSGEEDIIEATAIGDADNDGQNEFIVGTDNIHVISYNGVDYEEESTITQTSGQLAGAIIGDCDSDGLNEVKANDILTSPGAEWILEFTPEPTWLSVTPTSGTVPIDSSTDVTLSFNAAGLVPDSYSTIMIINNNDLDENPTNIPITLTVLASGPLLQYSPPSYNFGDILIGGTGQTSFEIWNGGTDSLTYDLDWSCSWVTVTPDTGSSTGEYDTITIDIDTTGLSSGNHQCDIEITSNGGSGTFTIYVNVITGSYEELDQSQTDGTYTFTIYNARWASQSFIPTLDNLAKVDLLVSKKGSPSNELTIAIRDSLTGSDITSITKTPAEIPTTQTWIEFDLPDITTTPGTIYYIVAYTTGGDSLNCYHWHFGAETPYTDGALHFSSDSGSTWRQYIYYDYAFKTYALTGPSIPMLAFDPSSYDFSDMFEGETDSTTFDIWNSGTGTLSYTLTPEYSWVTVNPTNGDSTGETDTIDVDIDTTGLGLGAHSCDIDITSNGGSETFTIYVNIIEPTPALSYNPTSHDFSDMFEGETDSTTFDIWNSGTGTLTYSLAPEYSWVTVNPTNGDSTGETDTIDVDIDTTGLSLGSHQCDVIITTNDGIGAFTVYVNIIEPTPILSFNPTNYNFGTIQPDTTDSTTFEIWNSGTGTLNYNLQETETWLSVTPTSGDSTGEHDTITINVDTNGLTDGTYTHNIDIISDGGNAQFNIQITVQTGGTEQMDQQQTTGTYGLVIYSSRWGGQSFVPTLDNLARVDLSLSKRGTPTDSLTVAIRDSLTGSNLASATKIASEIPTSQTWIEFDLPDITTTPGNTYYIIAYTTAGTSQNCYNLHFGVNTPYTDGALQLSSNGGSSWNQYAAYDICFKTYGITGPPVPILSYNPTSHDFDDMLEGEIDSTSFDIWNSGTGTLTYTLTPQYSWITTNPSNGDSTGEHDTITVDIDTNGLSPGFHTCDITITSNGGTNIYTVYVNIVEPTPILSYNPTSYNFGSLQPDQTTYATFEIWNSGTGTLNYNLVEDCSWLEITPTTGDSTGEHDTITVDIDTTGLEDGNYQYDITINSDYGTGTFHLELTVQTGGTEQLDQQQTDGTYVFMTAGTRYAGQSFIPTLDNLAKVDLLVSKKGSPSNELTIAIRDSLTDSDITSITKTPAEIPTTQTWIEFDLPDITTTPGTTYYIVAYTTGGDSSNCYYWHFGADTPYTDGTLHFSSDSGSTWRNYMYYDFAFKTYGIN